MELLAPAGGEEQLDYAMLFGADAVYLACERFGMRARATNFQLEDLGRVVAKAHDAGVKVHLTCNAMMHPEDLAQIPPFLEAASAAGVDALIIGDMGVAAMARKYAPGTDIHVSTQASICNAEAAAAWHDMGATRIVAARESSLANLAAMKESMPQEMELEAFAHGAMCMAYSGRCLVSDFLNGRSGVRGNCAQSCRWRYTLTHGTELVFGDQQGSYILNAEDLCMIDHLKELEEAGVDSIKIEGRTKKAYYVACVVNAYRQVLDGADPGTLMRELNSVSHRPYSTGFYFGRGKQTSESLTYIRKTSWAAQVISCEEADEGRWRIELKCRDKFSLSDHLEVLSPRTPVRQLNITELWHIPASRENVLSSKASPDWTPYQDEPCLVTEAMHPAERYYATVDTPLQTNDIIRVLR